jgi:hypothetical protein
MPRMAAPSRPLAFTEIEVRSQLPSGWGIAPGSAGRWDPKLGSWSIDLSDGADNTWTVSLTPADVEKGGRPGALAGKIRQLERKALGRKSILSG